MGLDTKTIDGYMLLKLVFPPNCYNPNDLPKNEIKALLDVEKNNIKE